MSALITGNTENRCEAFSADPGQEDNHILTELNDVELVMGLSSKSLVSEAISQNQHIAQQVLKQAAAITHVNTAASSTVSIAHQQYSISNLQHIHNLHNQHSCQSSFFTSHSTPFSVTDILSPAEESYRKFESNGNPTSPYRSNSSRSSINSPSALVPSTMANPYTMSSIYHNPGVQSYCGPTENISLAGHYTDMRPSASWYGTTANDPRFAISRLMGGSASGTMGHMGNMGSLATCSVSDAKSLQFPLTQRRKRRVLFTQAQAYLLRRCDENKKYTSR